MRNAVTYTGPNGLEVQKVSTRDFLYPDADEKYTPLVLAYVHDFDIAEFNERLKRVSPPEAVEAFTYLSAREKYFTCRGSARAGDEAAGRRVATIDRLLKSGLKNSRPTSRKDMRRDRRNHGVQRGRLFMVSPVQGDYRRCQAETRPV